MFSLIWAWRNDWVNNREAGGLRRHRTHYDVAVMHLEPDPSTHCGLVTLYDVTELCQTDSGNGLLSEPMLTTRHWGFLAFTWWQCHRKNSWYFSFIRVWKWLTWYCIHCGFVAFYTLYHLVQHIFKPVSATTKENCALPKVVSHWQVTHKKWNLGVADFALFS